MRRKTPVTSYISALVCLLVAGYFGIQAWNYYTDPFSTMVIYQYQANESVVVSGYVVREEVPLANQDSGVLSHSRQEGERVSANGEVARVYASQEALDNQATLEDLQTRSAQLSYALEAVENAENTLLLDQEIFQQLLTYRQELVADELDKAATQGASLRNLVVTQDFTQTDTLTLKDYLDTTNADLSTAGRSQSSASKLIKSSQSGIYSAVVDGYEGVLTPETVSQWTPSTLSAITPDDQVYSNVGKLVLGSDWYYVVNVPTTVATQADYAGWVNFSFTKSFDTTVKMDVVSISDEEDGLCTLVLHSDQYIGELTLLREQSATLIFESLSGFRIPNSALRVNEDGQTGIYCLVGIRARFKPVEVVYEGSDFLLVEAASGTALQDGEQVVIAANDLFDGKVIE